MNNRERYLETVLFGSPDKIPLMPGTGRKSTRETWHRQGLPQETDTGEEITAYAYKLSGGREKLQSGGETFPVNERMIPMFEEKVIENRGDTQIVQDWKGNICEISSEFSTEYLRGGIDFVTRRWIKCPVENRDDWESMKQKYNPDDISRLPANAEKLGISLCKRTYPVKLHFSGPFWQLREWLGFENLCTMFYDDPEFVRDMINFWQQYIIRLMENAFRYFIPDEIHISEDMAYKSFSMISPDMARDFLLPVWKQWGELIKKNKIPVYGIDSDGYIGELLPLWIEAGMNICDPVEVAAGNDINEFRKKFGRTMAFRGGVDKRAIAKGGHVLEAEIERLKPVIRSGGFIPSCDHGVPPDVSWENFVYFIRLLAAETGW
ncbi:MAG: hypothetical protein A2096_03190 [Spirochaetes bacterium GWF1_41_5]|nr:MAG: hypothetical protein A2096_03190 [Spirochaetes bacterium GWF1_41_5]